ncbi:MAG: Uncharacterised protein [Acidimicrobiales bacterium AG-410-I20]|nr:MAG: Uncharacterised protein [Acidimicrobiales bacterium AG-410-I20]
MRSLFEGEIKRMRRPASSDELISSISPPTPANPTEEGSA